MALVLADRVKDTTTTTGTGSVTLSGSPPAGFQSFGAAIGNGNTTYYTISGGSQFEVGIGTYNSAGPTLNRDTVLSSSNSGSLVNFSAGTKDVFVTYPAEKSVNEDATGNVNIDITGNATTATRATNLAAGAAGSVPYQTAANTTAFLASASGVLVGGNPPTFSTTPTLTGTNFSAIPNAALSNSSVTIGTTSVALGATSTTLAGLTSVTLTQDPTLALQAATKQYVDTVASTGIHFHQPVRVEAPTNLNATYANGTAGVGATLTNAGTQAALVIDGVTLSVADRVLIFQQTTQTQNGIYVVTTVGSVSTNWVLTRSSDADTFVSASPDGLSEGSTVFVQQGTTGAGGTYTCNTPGTITFGTTNITFAQVSSAQIYSAGTGLTLTGTQFSLTTPVATTLGGTGLTTFGATNRALFSSGTNTLTAGTLPTAAGGTGQTTYVNGELLIGKTSDGSLAKATLTASTGISVTNGDGSITITNTAPDQTVSLTGSGTTTITGTYPNFNVASADQYVGTVTSVSASVDTTGTDIAVAVTSSTTTPAIALSIPTSSSSARGALTSTDWSTFNGKQAALVSGTNIKTINGTSVLGSGDLSTLSTPLAVVGNATAGAEIRLPEDTDNGSNYVALKAPDTLAANLTLTLPTADGTSGQVLQTNGSGQLSFASSSSGTQQFTSSGSITAGQAVSLNSNGTVSTTTGVDQAATFNTATAYGSGSQYVFGSFYDSSTGWHFTGFKIGSYAYLFSYKVSAAGAITNLNSIGIFSFDATNYRRGVIVKDTTSGRINFLIGGSANDYAGTVYMQAVTVNTSTGALTSAGFTSVVSTSGSRAPFDAYFDSFANRIVAVGYTGSGTINVTAYSNNGSSFSQTASTSFSMLDDQAAGLAAAFNSNTNAGRAFFRVSPFGWVGTRTISLNAAGNTFTIGAEQASYGASFNTNGRAGYFPSIDRFILQFSSSASTHTVLINPSTGSPTASSTTTPLSSLYYSWEAYGFCNSYDTVGNVVYNTSSSTEGGVYTWSYTLTASSITYANGSSYTANPYLARGTAITFDPTLGRGGITAYDYSAASTYLIGFLPALFSTNADKFIGFSTQSVSTGAPVTVTILGGVNTNQSALTTNAAYYLQLTGALSTTPSAYGIVARALSATSVQVTTGGAFKKLISQTVISGSPSSVTLTLPSGYSQFEIAFQDIRGGTTSTPILTGFNSGGSAVGVLGRGQAFLPASSVSSYTQSANLLALTGGQNHSASSVFGGSLLLQSTAIASNIWSYTLMTSFNNSGDAYFSGTGYFNGVSVTAVLSGFGTLTNGVVTLYGIG
jgi:hypothetical protein